MQLMNLEVVDPITKKIWYNPIFTVKGAINDSWIETVNT